MNWILLLTILWTYLFLNVIPANAQYVQKGGEVINQITINKEIVHPTSGQFVDNLTVTDTHFLPQQTITFRIQVRNDGNQALQNISVKDQLPNLVDFLSGPGNFDSNNKSLSFNIDNLNPGETKSFEVKNKIKPASQLPVNQVTCLTNVAQASKDSLFSQDMAGFCLETQLLAPVQKLPVTGPSTTTLTLVGSTALLLASLLIFRKSKAK